MKAFQANPNSNLPSIPPSRNGLKEHIKRSLQSGWLFKEGENALLTQLYPVRERETFHCIHSVIISKFSAMQFLNINYKKNKTHEPEAAGCLFKKCGKIR